MTWIHALIIAIVEGITEFLPISSTGHMIIAEKLLGLNADDPFIQAFIVNIQFGAILSVVVIYWKKFFQSLNFYYKLFIAFIPAAFFGLLFSDLIDKLLGNVAVVASMLVIGGIVLVFVDNWFKDNEKLEDQELTYKKSFIIGLFQVIAMIPGVSRSASTIIGGMTQKLNRKNAAEFSFFLAVPTMAAASGYKLLENYKVIDIHNIGLLIFGNIISFIVALFAIKTFISFLTKNGFKIFGYYRIVIGLVILSLLFFGVKLNIV